MILSGFDEQVRKWLEGISARKEEMSSRHRPPGLTDARRVELQGKIMAWRETHQVGNCLFNNLSVSTDEDIYR